MTRGARVVPPSALLFQPSNGQTLARAAGRVE